MLTNYLLEQKGEEPVIMCLISYDKGMKSDELKREAFI